MNRNFATIRIEREREREEKTERISSKNGVETGEDNDSDTI